MTGDREQMKKALKTIVVPTIRNLGFTGSFPHFRRKRNAEYQMLMLMFNKYGGSFYLEAGRLSAAEFINLQERWATSGKPLSEASLTVGHCGWKQRARLGGRGATENHWFTFGADKYQNSPQSAPGASQYEAVAKQV